MIPDPDRGTPIEEARLAVEQLRESWGWLCELVEPSRQPGATLAVDDRQAEVLEARGRSDRAYRDWNLRLGMSALPPTPAPASLEVVDAQVYVHRILLDLGRLAARAQRASFVGGRAGMLATVVSILDWLDGTGGRGRFVATVDGVVWRQGQLEIMPIALVLAAGKDLARADRAARSAARVVGIAAKEVRFRCPACRRRSLQLQHDGEDKTQWYVRCVSDACRCTGEGCGCLQRRRVVGRAHSWPYGELESAYGLRNAVAVADALAEHRMRENGVDREVRSESRGHGGWSNRRVE